MRDLSGALVYATRRGPGTVKFDSAGERCDTVASFATRCSMSIPVVFVPPSVDGRRTYDGGLRNNFPLTRFLQDHPNTPFLALYLRAGGNERNRKWFMGELLDIWLDGEERQVVDKHSTEIVKIDTSPIGTIDFKLSALEKQFLVSVGRAAALEFLGQRNLDNGPDDATVRNAISVAEAQRKSVRRFRRRRVLKRASFVVGVVALMAAANAFATSVGLLSCGVC